MGREAQNPVKAAELPDGDVIRILLEQHEQVRDLFARLRTAPASGRKDLFDDLRALLAVHETAEEIVLRPLADDETWKQVAAKRNEEEREANEVLADLEGLDVRSDDFLAKLTEFERSVDEHATAEEEAEFPRVLSARDVEQRRKLGVRLRAVEKMAPSHPHPSAAGSPARQALTGPFASMVDRVRDAMST